MIVPPTLEDTTMDCWHDEIDKSKTEEEVVRCATDYLVLWAPRELGPLALGLVEMSIESPEDIERVKRWLTDNHMTANSKSPRDAHLRELSSYFWHASSRIADLRRERAGVPSASVTYISRNIAR
jgi:hypothetical protein